MSYTLIVGTQQWSSWSLRPYLALVASGAAFKMEVIRLRHTAPEPLNTRQQILAHSPAGRVPVLKIAENGETLTVWDSLAICETLAERHPGLWPSDPKLRAIARSYASEMHSGFPDMRDQLTMEFVRRLPLPDLRETTSAQIARILEAWETALDNSGGPFLFGNFCIADCMYGPVVSRFVTYGVAVSEPVRGYMDRVMALPAMQAWGEAAQKEVDAGIA
jgi:glutathione S-transferase